MIYLESILNLLFKIRLLNETIGDVKEFQK